MPVSAVGETKSARVVHRCSSGQYITLAGVGKMRWTESSKRTATFDRTAASFHNPDHVSIVIPNHRWRLSLAKGVPRDDDLEQKLFAAPVIAVPAITIASDLDGPAADATADARHFSGKISHRIFQGIGHNVPQAAPQAFAKAVVDVDGF
jgi:pimeloyl-ACP methyl ester carboxylesterase